MKKLAALTLLESMQSMGHGVGLGDYGIERDAVSVPYVEFGSHSLSKDYQFKRG